MTERRIAALTIAVFSATFVAALMLLGDASGALGDSDPTFIDHYASASRRTGDIAGGVALVVAGASFLVFVALARATFNRESLALGVFSQAGTAFAVLLIVAAALFITTPLSMSFGGLFDDTGQFGGVHASVLPQAATVLVLVAAYPVGALAIAAVAVASRTGNVLPRWHRWVGYACAAVMPVAFFFVPIIALPIWSVATAIALWRRATLPR